MLVACRYTRTLLQQPHHARSHRECDRGAVTQLLCATMIFHVMLQYFRMLPVNFVLFGELCS